MADVITITTPRGVKTKIKWLEKRDPTDAEIDEIAKSVDQEDSVASVIKSPFFGGQAPKQNTPAKAPVRPVERSWYPNAIPGGYDTRELFKDNPETSKKLVASQKKESEDAKKRGILGQFGEAFKAGITGDPAARQKATASQDLLEEAIKGSKAGQVFRAMSPLNDSLMSILAAGINSPNEVVADANVLFDPRYNAGQKLGAMTTVGGAVANMGAAAGAVKAGKGVSGALNAMTGADMFEGIADRLAAKNAKKAVQAVGDRIKVKTVKEPVVPFDMTPQAKANLADFEKRSAGYAPKAGPEGGVIDIRSLLSEPPPDIPKTIAAPQGAPAQGAPSALSRVKEPWANVRTYKGDGGKSYQELALGGDRSLGMVTVELDKKAGYRVRNIYVDSSVQRKGYATGAYEQLNRESMAATGKPLRSSNIGYAKKSDPTSLSEEGVKLWESLASQGKAQKVGTHYEFLPTPDLPAVDFRPNTGMGTLTEGQRNAAAATPKGGITTEQSLADDLAKSLEQAQAAKGGAKPRTREDILKDYKGESIRPSYQIGGSKDWHEKLNAAEAERMKRLGALEQELMPHLTVDDLREVAAKPPKARTRLDQFIADAQVYDPSEVTPKGRYKTDIIMQSDVDGESWWTNTHAAFKGKSPHAVTSDNRPNIGRIIPEYPGDPAKFIGSAVTTNGKDLVTRYVFESANGGTAAVDAKYINLARKLHGKDVEFFINGKKPVKVMKKGELVGVIMPMDSSGVDIAALKSAGARVAPEIPAQEIAPTLETPKNLSKAQAAEQNVKRIAVERAQAKGETVSPEDLQAAGLKAPASPVDAPKGAVAVETPAGQKPIWAQTEDEAVNRVWPPGKDVPDAPSGTSLPDHEFAVKGRRKDGTVWTFDTVEPNGSGKPMRGRVTDPKMVKAWDYEYAVRQAHAEGKSVPNEVLSKFPDLAPPKAPDIPVETPRTARNADSNAIAVEEGINPPKGKDKPFNIRQSQETAKANYSAETARNIIGDFEAKNRPLTADETGTLSTHVEKLREARATLRTKAATGDADAIERLATNTKDLERTLQTLKSGGSESSASMNVRRNLDLVDYSDPDEVVAEAKGQLATEELPKKLEDALRSHAKELAKKDAEYAAKEAEYKRLLAEAIANNEGKTRPRGAARTAEQIRADIARRAAERQAKIARTEKKAAKARQGGAANVSAEDLQYLAQQARDYIQLGATSLVDIVKAMKADGIDATVEEVADALTYKSGQRTRSELQQRMDALKKEANALSPTAQARREAVKAGREANADSVKVAKIRAEIADLQEQLDTNTFVIKDAVARVKGSEDLERLRLERARLKSQIKRRIEENQRGFVAKTALGLAQNVRGMMLGGDLGILTRQGKTALGNPQNAIPAFGRAVTAARSEQKALALEQDILKRFDAAGAKKAGLSVTVGTDEGEELGVAKLAKWVADILPGKGTKLGDAIRNAPGGLDRFQKIYINEYRMRAFEQAQKAGYSASELKDRAAFINAATGRSNIKSVGPLMQTIFTSPRYEASRWELLASPATQVRNLGRSAMKGEGLNKGAIKNFSDLAKEAAVTLGVIEMAKRAGYSFNWEDETRSDYMKLRRGEEVWDISAGLAPRLRDLMKAVRQFRADPDSEGWITTLGKAVGRSLSPSIKTTTGQASIAYQRYVNGSDDPKDPWSGFSNEGDAEGLLAFGPLIYQAFKKTMDATKDPAETAGAFFKEFLGGSVNRLPE